MSFHLVLLWRQLDQSSVRNPDCLKSVLEQASHYVPTEYTISEMVQITANPERIKSRLLFTTQFDRNETNAAYSLS